MTSSRRSTAASIAALERWGREPDPQAATAPARRGFADRFARQADPDGVLTPAERQVRADRLMRAHMKRLSARAAAKRQRRAS